MDFLKDMFWYYFYFHHWYWHKKNRSVLMTFSEGTVFGGIVNREKGWNIRQEERNGPMNS